MAKNIRNHEKPTAIDLFSGCGGLTLGLRKAGFRVVGAVELNHLAVETYKKNHSNILVWENDIRSLNPEILREELGLKKKELSLLAGCPPCQGFSRLRTKNGSYQINDPRNDLLFDFERFVDAFRPQAIMMENVPWLADDARFSIFLQRIWNLGYQGVPHIMQSL